MRDYYLGIEWYLENYIISEQMDNYRLKSFWHHWLYRGLFAAIAGDSRFIVGWTILDSESV